MTSQDILGSISIIKSEKGGRAKTWAEKLAEAKEILKRPSVKTVLEKSSNVHRRLRTIKTKHIMGEKNLIAEHKENGVVVRFNVESCYFSPRLSNERKEIAKKIRAKDRVLVMFAGVGIYPIVIYREVKPVRMVGIELGRECCKFFKENLKLNKISSDAVEIIQGDVKRKIGKGFEKFDVVVMARPNLKDSFLEQGLNACRKGGKIYYYGFSHEDDLKGLKAGLVAEAKGLGRRVRIVKVVKAGDIAPYKFRWRIEMKVD